QVLKKQPASGAAHFLLAKALLLQSNTAAAEPEIRSIVNANPSSSEVQVLLGDLYFAKRDLREAREAYLRAAQGAPSSIAALTGLVNVDLADKKKDAARSRLDSRLAATPD